MKPEKSDWWIFLIFAVIASAIVFGVLLLATFAADQYNKERCNKQLHEATREDLVYCFNKLLGDSNAE